MVDTRTPIGQSTDEEVTHTYEDTELHTAILAFEYDDAAYARIVARSVRQELDEIEGNRTTATLAREGATVTIEVTAADLVALRAGCNTWLTLVKTAESLADVGFSAEN